MLDVHPPHESVHSWRDFLIHIGTITLGLFIALSLEGVVEAAHHRHLVRHARENIRQEITENRRFLTDDLSSLHDDRAQMAGNMQTFRSMLGSGDANGRQISLGWRWSAMSSAAWETARETGALSYMPYNEVQSFAELYGQQQLVNNEAASLIRNQASARIPLLIEPEGSAVPKLTDAELGEAMHRTAETINQIDLIHDLMNGLKSSYDSRLAAAWNH